MKHHILTVALAIGCASFAGAGQAASQPEGTPGPAARAPSDCDSMYFEGVAPVAMAAAARLEVFCHQIYVSGYSTMRLNPLWVAQRLTREDMLRGEDVFRADESTFAPEPLLDDEEQAADSDFNGNDWDKGHMAPANDAPDIPSQLDTFYLSNAVPQHYRLNRYMWAYLEGSVHQLAALHGEVYVVTGPNFARRPELMNGRVAIPAETFKAIYIPSLQMAVGFIATNGTNSACRIVSINVLARQTGIDPFPSLPARLRSRRPLISLPNGVIVRSNGTRARQTLPNCRASRNRRR